MSYRMPSFELMFAFFVYIGSLVYALYQSFDYGTIIDVPENENSFTKGWTFVGRKRDDYDDEWESFVEHITSYSYWYICHASISEIVRLLNPSKVCLGHATIGLLFVLFNFNPFVSGAIFTMVFSYYILMFTDKRFIWLLTVLWLILVNLAKQSDWEEWLTESISPAEIFDALIALSWLMLRLLSFTVDFCNAKASSAEYDVKERFAPAKFLAFSFYLPVFLHGPPLIYDRYVTMFDRNRIQPVEETFSRLTELIVNLFRILAVYFLNEICMHLVYANIVIYNPDLMQHMNLWPMYGFAYSMGQFFCNKYIVSYGLGIVLMKFDRITAPKMPMCIGRIHLYSHMWRYFDQGLHDFLFKHIYEELCTKTSSLWRKFFASSISFVFIYLWHGYYFYLMAWVFLNLALLYLELVGRHYSRSEHYERLVIKRIGRKNAQRLNALFGSQLLIPSIITNLMFIGGSRVGQFLATRTYFTGGYLNYFLLSFVAYNFYQASSFIFECEKEKGNELRRKAN